MAVWTKNTEIHQAIIFIITIDMVQMKCKNRTLPFGDSTSIAPCLEKAIAYKSSFESRCPSTVFRLDRQDCGERHSFRPAVGPTAEMPLPGPVVGD